MRYRKDCISLNDERDIPLLLIIRNAGAVTFSQLIDELFHLGLEKSDKSAQWRIRRLVSQGLLAKRHLTTIGEPVYVITQSGLTALEFRGHYLLTLNSESNQFLTDSQIGHMMEVNSVRIALLRAGILNNWQSRLEMRAAEFHIHRMGIRTTNFDAVATVRYEGRPFRFAIKIEKTIKNASRYQEIAEFIRQDARAPLVLYLASDELLLRALIRGLSFLGSRVAFCTTKQFKTDALATPVITGSDMSEFHSFRELLLRLPPGMDDPNNSSLPSAWPTVGMVSGHAMNSSTEA